MKVFIDRIGGKIRFRIQAETGFEEQELSKLPSWGTAINMPRFPKFQSMGMRRRDGEMVVDFVQIEDEIGRSTDDPEYGPDW